MQARRYFSLLQNPYWFRPPKEQAIFRLIETMAKIPQEHVLSLSILKLKKSGVFRQWMQSYITVNGELYCTIDVELWWCFPFVKVVELATQREKYLYLEYTKPHFGWKRRRFMCPLCEWRYWVLYRAQYYDYYTLFACRTCENLCYEAQTVPVRYRISNSICKKSEQAKELMSTIKNFYRNWKITRKWKRYYRLSHKFHMLCAAQRVRIDNIIKR